LFQRLFGPLGVAQVGVLELESALGLHCLAADFVEFILGNSKRLLCVREPAGFCGERRVGSSDPLPGAALAARPHVQSLGQLGALFPPGAQLRAQFDMPILKALPGLFDVAEFRFMPGNLGIRPVQGRLCGIQAIACRVVRASRGFNPAFGFPEAGGLRFKGVGRPKDFLRVAFTLGSRIAAAQKPEHLLLEEEVGLEFLVAARDFGLLFEFLDLRPKLGADVRDPGQVFAGIGQAILRLPAPFLVFGNTGGFLEENAQLLGFGLDDSRNHSLLDDSIGPRPETGAKEDVGDVAPSDVGVVDVVRGIAIPL